MARDTIFIAIINTSEKNRFIGCKVVSTYTFTQTHTQFSRYIIHYCMLLSIFFFLPFKCFLTLKECYEDLPWPMDSTHTVSTPLSLEHAATLPTQPSAAKGHDDGLHSLMLGFFNSQFTGVPSWLRG